MRARTQPNRPMQKPYLKTAASTRGFLRLCGGCFCHADKYCFSHTVCGTPGTELSAGLARIAASIFSMRWFKEDWAASSLHLRDPVELVLAGLHRGVSIETAPRPIRPITSSLDERRVSLSQLKRG